MSICLPVHSTTFMTKLFRLLSFRVISGPLFTYSNLSFLYITYFCFVFTTILLVMASFCVHYSFFFKNSYSDYIHSSKHCMTSWPQHTNSRNCTLFPLMLFQQAPVGCCSSLESSPNIQNENTNAEADSLSYVSYRSGKIGTYAWKITLDLLYNIHSTVNFDRNNSSYK